MCQIIFDIEIMGFLLCNGNCILEIGCVEVFNCQFLGKNFYFYINFE